MASQGRPTPWRSQIPACRPPLPSPGEPSLAQPAGNPRRKPRFPGPHADLILAGEATKEAYVMHFEAQMRRGKVRKLLYTSFLQFARSGAMLGLNPIGIWWTPTDFDT